MDFKRLLAKLSIAYNGLGDSVALLQLITIDFTKYRFTDTPLKKKNQTVPTFKICVTNFPKNKANVFTPCRKIIVK